MCRSEVTMNFFLLRAAANFALSKPGLQGWPLFALLETPVTEDFANVSMSNKTSKISLEKSLIFRLLTFFKLSSGIT